jgi:hypothetical protein
MAPGGKQSGTRNLASRERLTALSTFLDPGRKLSIRSCLYRLSAMSGSDGRKLYPGTDINSYRSLKELIRTARISGELDDDCFIDNKRILLEGETNGWENIEEYMRPHNPHHYERNRWQDQPDRIQVWLEKDTLRGLIASICRKWDVTRLISMGTLIEEWAQRGNNGDGNRRTEGLLELLVTKFDWTSEQYEEQIRWERVAVTLADFQNPQLAPYKISIKDAGRDEETSKCLPGHDPRAEEYKEAYGGQCLEVEALEVLNDGEIANRLDAYIHDVIDLDLWQASERKQRREIRNWIRTHPEAG